MGGTRVGVGIRGSERKMAVLNPDIKKKVLEAVEAHQPVTAGKVTSLLESDFGITMSPEEVTAYLFKMRTDFPKRIVRSADRYSVVDLG